METINFRQTREVRDIVNTTFSFLRQNFLKLGKSIIFVAGPFLLVATIMFVNANQAATTASPTVFTGRLLFMGLLFGVAILAATIVINEYVALYVQSGHNQFDVNDVSRAALSHIGRYVLAGLAIFFIITTVYLVVITLAVSIHPILALGMFAVGYLVISFLLTFIIIPVEGLGALEAISRSKELVTGYWWQTFGLWILTYFIEMVLTIVLYIPLFTIMFLVELNTPGASEQIANSSLQLVTAVISFVVIFGAFLLHTIQTVAIGLQYFNLVERKEGTGLLQEIEQIGGEEASSQE